MPHFNHFCSLDIIESERKNRIKNQESPAKLPAALAESIGKPADIDGGGPTIPAELSQASSIVAEQSRQKYEQSKSMRIEITEKLEEESVKAKERALANSGLSDEITKLMHSLHEERQVTRKLETDNARDRAMIKMLEEKLARENARRDEIVNELQAELLYLREVKSKIVLILEKDKKHRDQLVVNINEIGKFHGMGSVITPSLASIIDPNLLLAKKEMLKSVSLSDVNASNS